MLRFVIISKHCCSTEQNLLGPRNSGRTHAGFVLLLRPWQHHRTCSPFFHLFMRALSGRRNCTPLSSTLLKAKFCTFWALPCQWAVTTSEKCLPPAGHDVRSNSSSKKVCQPACVAAVMQGLTVCTAYVCACADPLATRTVLPLCSFVQLHDTLV